MNSNSSEVPQLLFGDVIAAAAAATGVAPFITVIDRSIFRAAAGSKGLWAGIKEGFTEIISNPGKFIKGRDLRLIWGVYCGTYVAANMATTLSEAAGVSPELPKFFASSAANILLCIRKDAIFAKMFGTGTQATVPLTSLSLFTLRDSMTTAASFNAPALISAQLLDMSAEKNWGLTKTFASNFAQLTCPAAVQLFSTPVHLLALDLFNRPGQTAAGRAAFIAGKYPSMVAARCARIIPAFGIGGIGNRVVRESYRDYFKSPEQQQQHGGHHSASPSVVVEVPSISHPASAAAPQESN